MGCWWFSRVTFLLSELVERQDFWNLCVVLLLEMVARATLVLGQLDFFMFCDWTFVALTVSSFLKIFRSLPQE